MFVERLEQHFVLSKHINVSWYVLIFFISMIRIPSPLISFFFFPESSPFIYLFIYLWLRWVFAARAFSSCREWGLRFAAVCGLLIAMASLVAEHEL